MNFGATAGRAISFGQDLAEARSLMNAMGRSNGFRKPAADDNVREIIATLTESVAVLRANPGGGEAPAQAVDAVTQLLFESQEQQIPMVAMGLGDSQSVKAASNIRAAYTFVERGVDELADPYQLTATETTERLRDLEYVGDFFERAFR